MSEYSAQPFPYDIVGFDLDGTLIDTSGSLAAAASHALSTIGLGPLTKRDIRPVIGLGASAIIARGLPYDWAIKDAEAARLRDVMLAHYEGDISGDSKPFPGALAILDELDNLKVPYCIVTNKAEHLANKLLGEMGLSKRFAFILGGDSLGPGKSKPNPALLLEMIKRTSDIKIADPPLRAVYVGDSPSDIDAAKAAKIESVFCEFGFFDGDCRSLDANVSIANFEQLIPALRRIGGPSS